MSLIDDLPHDAVVARPLEAHLLGSVVAIHRNPGRAKAGVRI